MNKKEICGIFNRVKEDVCNQHIAHFIRAIEEKWIRSRTGKHKFLFRVILKATKQGKLNKAWNIAFANGSTIRYSSQGSIEQQRFLVAHELGHLALHEKELNIKTHGGTGKSTNIFDNDIQKETEATFFARLIIEERGSFYRNILKKYSNPKISNIVKSLYNNYDEKLI